METQHLPAVDWIIVILGIVLAVSPFVLGFPAGAAVIAPVIGGIVVAVLALLTSLTYGRWGGWVNFILVDFFAGAVVFISPVLFHFNDTPWPTAVPMVVGTAVFILEWIQMYRVTGPARASDMPTSTMVR